MKLTIALFAIKHCIIINSISQGEFISYGDWVLGSQSQSHTEINLAVMTSVNAAKQKN